MASGAKVRSQLLRQHFEPLVAAHRQIRGDHPGAVMLLLQAGQASSWPPHATALETGQRDHDQGETAIAFMPREAARSHFAEAPGLSKWEVPERDAMDVAVVAAGGVTLMRLTSR